MFAVTLAAVALLAAHGCGGDDEGSGGGTATGTTTTTSVGGSGGVIDPGPTHTAAALILDGELRHHSSWIDVLGALDDAGVAASYRRFFPHVTAADVSPTADVYPYEIVVMAAGRSPGNPASLSRLDEVDQAVAFVQGGGALVLVPQHGWSDSYSGENDYFIHNRILEQLEVPVRVERNTVVGQVWTSSSSPHEPTDWGYPTPLEFQLGYPYLLDADEQSIAGGICPMLRVASDQVQVLLRTHDRGYNWKALSGIGSVVSFSEEHPIATLAPAGEGFVAVVPRGPMLLSAATGNLSDKPAMDAAQEAATRAFVTTLMAQLHALVQGDATFEVTEVLATDTLFSVSAPNVPAYEPNGEVISLATSISTRALPASPPAGNLVETPPPPPPSPRTVPTWFTNGVGRIAYGGLTADPADMAVAFDEVVSHGIDALMTSTDPSLLATLTGPELAAEEAKYIQIAAAAETAGAKWFVGDWFNASAGSYPAMVGAHGYATDVPAPLSEDHWSEVVIPMYAAVGNLAATNPAIAGIHLDLELYSGPIYHHDGWAFSDDTLEHYVAGLADQALADQLRNAPYHERLDELVDRGLLGDYFAALEEAAYDLGRRCREAARENAPDIELMVYTAGFANTWFYQGLLRGLGTHDKPVIVLTYDAWASSPTEALYAEGVELVHLGGTIVSHFLPDDFRDSLVALADGNDGYWYFLFNDFSATNPAPPALHGSSAEYWTAVDEANALLP